MEYSISKNPHEELLIKLLDNLWKDLTKFVGMLEEKEEQEKMPDE